MNPDATATRELAHRQSGTVEVALLWRSAPERVELFVQDLATGASFGIEVAPESALEAFYHPYAYAAGCRGCHPVDKTTALRA